MDTEEWIEKVRQGDSNAFEPLIRMYQQKIFAFCYFMLGQKQEAEDAVQDVFLKAYKNLHTFRYNLSFLAWLYKIAANHCRTLLKRKQRWKLLMPLLRNSEQEKSAEEVYGEQNVDWPSWLIELSTIEKQILLLRVLEDQSFAEIAHILGEKPATVRKRFERIRKKMGEKKGERGKQDYEQGFTI